jgi:hypothetical protein
MIIEINDKIKSIINDMPYNKTVKNNAIKIYAALYIMSNRQNNFGYFPVSSEYLKSINVRYYKIIDYFEKAGLIQPYTRPVPDDKDIFNTIQKKYYDVNRGVCMKYKFLIPINGYSIDVNMTTNRFFRWYEIIQNSLLEYGYNDIKITRDSYGRRVHHNGIRNYKSDFKDYFVIDSISSQPRLLWLDMKEKNINDKEYSNIFENELDFYREIEYKLKLNDRDAAKDLFMYWVNGNGYVPNFNIHIMFPATSAYIKKYKSGNYKNMGSHLQRIESKIWIDDILNNIPTNFALPVHDSVIVKPEDADKVLEYCKAKYSQLRFKKEIIK